MVASPPPSQTPECTSAFFLDADGDGHGDPTVWATACSAPSGYADTNDDCDDTNAVVHPGADEICDGVDDDCDGSIDLGAVDAGVWFVDRDSDGYGDDASTSTQCDRPLGHVDVAGDCDDYDRAVSPEGVEVCDGIDDDCDELVDSLDDSLADGTIWYVDADADYFGDPTNPVSACEHPVGTVADDHDCNDADDAVNPLADEACDAFDNDCNGLTDDEESEPVVGEIRYYVDADGDGLGLRTIAPAPQDLCKAPEGWVTNADDCDDDDASVLGEIHWYYDDDGDGYGGDPRATSSVTRPTPSRWPSAATAMTRPTTSIRPRPKSATTRWTTTATARSTTTIRSWCSRSGTATTTTTASATTPTRSRRVIDRPGSWRAAETATTPTPT